MRKHYNLRIELIKKESIQKRMEIYGISDVSTIVRFILCEYYDYLNGNPAKKALRSMFKYIDLFRDRKITKHYNVHMATIVLISDGAKFDNVINCFKKKRINQSSLIRAAFESLFMCSVLELYHIEKESSFDKICKRLDIHQYKLLMSRCIVTPQDYEKLSFLANLQTRTVPAFVDNTLKSMAQYFYNDSDHYSTKFNREIIKKSMSVPLKKVESSEPISFMVGINGIDNITKILLMTGEFKIKSVNEFIRRGVRFIIDSYDRTISLQDTRDIVDDSDYSETKIVRNAFRNEVLYGNK